MSETMSEEEKMILRWLAKEDTSSLGECDGVSLRSLVQRGFASIKETIDGRRLGREYDRVSVTDAGQQWLRENAL